MDDKKKYEKLKKRIEDELKTARKMSANGKGGASDVLLLEGLTEYVKHLDGQRMIRKEDVSMHGNKLRELVFTSKSKIICDHCYWIGKSEEAKTIDNVSHCPKCGHREFGMRDLEYKDDIDT